MNGETDGDPKNRRKEQIAFGPKRRETRCSTGWN